ncbi:MAG: Asp-tRNA(Asn)/Glu-tRNA(Gln) amidotransferase subunit GatA [Candidatus Absconditabacteria bacterium]|nr:Asp-tRNA(Asn)/Glu-tRNA(Gln) amidotransferase subunit GatA [Candidatus Absconditabacteria bacterium]MDD4713880.1 Asp-tRNA(Asn)/Glu-tRNA(Gln) amidotransferase subunit GatA [Candidatus Absconditabacteria bacterium]
MQLTLSDYLSGVASGTFSPAEVLYHYQNKAKEKNTDLFAFLRFHDEYVAQHKDSAFSAPLRGAPIAIKDNIMTEGYISSCASKMLEHYVAPYSATCFSRLEAAGALMLGKTNMDEFAMGSSTEYSAFGPTKNPYGVDRIPGGSSGGSAAAVAADLCLAALGTDTGGSIRQPAALCGIVGLKPTYGRISRYGVQSMASSFDQIGTLTKTVADARILLGVISGYDPKDLQTSEKSDVTSFLTPSLRKPKDIRIAVPNQAFNEALDKRVEDLFRKKIEKLQTLGYQVEFVDFPLLEKVSTVYYLLIPAEVTSNLARFDGVKYGLQEEMQGCKNLLEYYSKVRNDGFSNEVKKRLLLGNYVVTHENYEKYYKKGLQARIWAQREFSKFFTQYDVVITPTTPTPASKLGEKLTNPLLMYLEDMYTVTANIAKIPAMSIPMGMVEDRGDQLPVGLQLMGNHWDEGTLLDIAEQIEERS